MNIKDYKHIYMIGIGGISMSGIAAILVKWGYKVSGSDSSDGIMVQKLRQSGIKVNIGQIEENITDDIDLVVYTAAIKKDNPELVKSRKLNIKTIERGNFLGEITKLFKDVIGIAGTHGKTTTSSMVSSAFMSANLDPSIQIGANLNVINGNYRVGDSDYFIIEACEYCESYLNFQQRSAIVTNIDNDHLDYFKNIDNIEKSFQKYVSKLKEDGLLVVNMDDERCYNLRNYTKANVLTVSLNNDEADYIASNIVFDENGYAEYDLINHGNKLSTIKLNVAGIHNVLNSLECIALCLWYGLDIESIKKGLLNFKGASRRLEYKGKFKGASVYDDYAHHPTEVKATSKAILNKKFNESWVVFEAHTYSRVKEHIDDFVESLKDFDHIIVIDIYAAREVNTYNVKEQDIIDKLLKIGKDARYIKDYDDIKKFLSDNVKENDLILTLGAGNVTKISNKLIED